PICQFDRLYVGFSLPDILEQKYNVRILFLQGGYLDVVQEKDGTINFQKEVNTTPDSTMLSKEATETTSAFAIDLKKIVIREMNVSYQDKVSNRTFNTRIDKLVSSLTMDTSNVTVALNTNMMLSVINEGDSMLFRDKAFQLDMLADYKLQSHLFSIANCDFKLEDAGFSVTGSDDFSDTTDLDFRVKGNKQDFNLFTAFL